MPQAKQTSGAFNTEELSSSGKEQVLAGEAYKSNADEVHRNDMADRLADRNLRKEYAAKVYRYLVFYSAFVAILLVLEGYEVYSFDLSDNVVMLLVGSTAAAAIGLVGFVIKGLFPAPK